MLPPKNTLNGRLKQLSRHKRILYMLGLSFAIISLSVITFHQIIMMNLDDPDITTISNDRSLLTTVDQQKLTTLINNQLSSIDYNSIQEIIFCYNRDGILQWKINGNPANPIKLADSAKTNGDEFPSDFPTQWKLRANAIQIIEQYLQQMKFEQVTDWDNSDADFFKPYTDFRLKFRNPQFAQKRAQEKAQEERAADAERKRKKEQTFAAIRATKSSQRCPNCKRESAWGSRLNRCVSEPFAGKYACECTPENSYTDSRGWNYFIDCDTLEIPEREASWTFQKTVDSVESSLFDHVFTSNSATIQKSNVVISIAQNGVVQMLIDGVLKGDIQLQGAETLSAGNQKQLFNDISERSRKYMNKHGFLQLSQSSTDSNGRSLKFVSQTKYIQIVDNAVQTELLQKWVTSNIRRCSMFVGQQGFFLGIPGTNGIDHHPQLNVPQISQFNPEFKAKLVSKVFQTFRGYMVSRGWTEDVRDIKAKNYAVRFVKSNHRFDPYSSQ